MTMSKKHFQQNFGKNFQLFPEHVVDTTDTLYQGRLYSEQYQKKYKSERKLTENFDFYNTLICTVAKFQKF